MLILKVEVKCSLIQNLNYISKGGEETWFAAQNIILPLDPNKTRHTINTGSWELLSPLQIYVTQTGMLRNEGRFFIITLYLVTIADFLPLSLALSEKLQ